MLSGIVTAILLVLFVGGWIWAWNPKRKQAFDAAARLPLDDQEPVAGEAAGNRNKEQSP
ncbi:cbb3-type cytochrome c oxidase subunit 3 [Lysobacter pythonis]|uniref:Cbb3-type cytochrome c oxidase subunit 3 n=1 Tax=Solilutibacter pythonis TaxID=2483112 RepID=A0A3M2I0C5_9GAMM|nr:cbb3-type cytochrome c oxidase subunit 3 [Lysobacter pythonis]RMH93845.1 cbb3-type cytochrome c oxidase subunit 3 [Lysobacter pythonis]